MEKRIAVIGAGNAGAAITSYLISQGAEVNMCDLFPSYLENLIANDGIDLTFEGKTSHQKPAMITTDLPKGIEGVRLIMVATPAFSHKMIAEAVAGSIKDGQIIVLNPGRTGGALEFLNTVRKNGCKADVTIAEAQTLIYSCRRDSKAGVAIYGVKHEVELAAFPATRTADVIEALQPYYPQFKATDSCLKTSFSNIGSLFHPTPVLMNVGRIETDKNGYKFYVDGISPSVAKVVHQIDLERQAVAAAYGVKVLSAEEWLRACYDTHGDDLYELLQNNAAYFDIYGPTTVEARYITEDIPMSLVPISELGHIAGVNVSNIDSVIQLASTMMGRDFRAEGRSAKNMGIEGMTHEQIINYFQTGEK